MRRSWQFRVPCLIQILTLTGVLLFSSCVREAPAPESTSTANSQAAGRQPDASLQPCAVMYAFAPEGELLRKAASIKHDTVWAGRAIAVGTIIQPVVIASSGIGMTNAAATTQHIIDTYHPKAIVFTGICGGVNPKHHIGDIVIPARWLTHDYGYWGKSGFRTDSVGVGHPASGGFQGMLDIPVDTALARQLGEAGDAVAFRFHTVMGRIPEIARGGLGISGNAFLDSKPKREQLYHDLQAEIVDMESAAVVQTAHAAGIPVAVVRSCSDLAGGSGSETASKQLDEFFKVAAHNSALVVQQFLETREQPGR